MPISNDDWAVSGREKINHEGTRLTRANSSHEKSSAALSE